MNDIITAFSQEDFKIIHREVVYQGIFRMVQNQVQHRKFDGGWTNPFMREIMERRSAVAVLPYDPIRDCVVLIEQFRAGAASHPVSPWLIEIVAGIYNQDESPEEVACRESEEEAGVKVIELYPICDYFVSPGGSNEYIHIFCGRVDADKPSGIYGLPHENEDIRAFTVPAEEAFAQLKQGFIKTSPAIISLQWLQLNREWLRKTWQTK